MVVGRATIILVLILSIFTSLSACQPQEEEEDIAPPPMEDEGDGVMMLLNPFEQSDTYGSDSDNSAQFTPNEYFPTEDTYITREQYSTSLLHSLAAKLMIDPSDRILLEIVREEMQNQRRVLFSLFDWKLYYEDMDSEKAVILKAAKERILKETNKGDL